MRSIISFVLAFFILTLSPISALADNDNSQKPVRFELTIKPNQQYAQIKLDGDDHRQIQLKAEYIKLNTVTNNHHIKVTITNNSGQILYHQLALIDKIEHSEVKYFDGTTEYLKHDDGKQATKILPYYNYGNIKSARATTREWYLSNTGKDEIEVQGYIISKEIPVVIDPKITQTDPNLAKTLTTYYSALRDNDLDLLLTTVPKNFSGGDLVQEYTESYNRAPGGVFPWVLQYISHPYDVVITSGFCYIHYTWVSPIDGALNEGGLELQKDLANTWWITR